MKVISKSHISRKNLLLEIADEKNIMATIKSDFIVKLRYCLQVLKLISKFWEIILIYHDYEHVAFSPRKDITNISTYSSSGKYDFQKCFYLRNLFDPNLRNAFQNNEVQSLTP